MLDKIQNRRWDEVRAYLLSLHPSDLADLIEELPENEQAVIFRLLPGENASDTFEYLDSQTQQSIIKNLGKQEVAVILNDMSPDDRTAYLEKLPDHILKETLNLLSDEERKIASSLLGYDENTVGHLMTPYYVQVRKGWTVGETFEHIRKFGKKAETLNVVYVVDKNHKLIDDIRIGEFLMAATETRIEELMDNKFIALLDTMDREEASASR
jgi:magnesium transporter